MRFQSENCNFGAETGERDGSQSKFTAISGENGINGKTTEGGRTVELIREIQRIQLWSQSLNGGCSSSTTPERWKNPIPILENRCTQLQAVRPGTRRHSD